VSFVNQFEDRDMLLSGLHAAQHTILGLLPLFVGTGDATEVQCDCFQHSFKLMLFEKHAHGVGVAKRLFNAFVNIMQAALQRLSECSCQSGCPQCCISLCSNRYFDKAVAIQVLRSVLE
jgi:DEAD/DEAH box helicase domain-containing protein